MQDSSKFLFYNYSKSRSVFVFTLYMVTEPATAYKRTRVSYIINILCLLHASYTVGVFLREVHYKGRCITKGGAYYRSLCRRQTVFVI